MHCAWPGDYHSLGLTRIQFHPPKVTPRIHSDEVTVQGLSYRNSSAWGWHNSHQSGVVLHLLSIHRPLGGRTQADTSKNAKVQGTRNQKSPNLTNSAGMPKTIPSNSLPWKSLSHLSHLLDWTDSHGNLVHFDWLEPDAPSGLMLPKGA